MARIRAERLLDAGAELGEGPVWDADSGDVVWVDILRGRVHRTALAGPDDRVIEVGPPVGAVVPSEAGRWFAALPDRVVAVDDPAHAIADVPHPAADLRSNDGKADPAGRLVLGTMTLGEPRAGAGTLWSIDGRGARPLVDGVTISNGLGWIDGGTRMLYVDTPTQRIDVLDYDVATGRVGGRRPWADIPAEMGSPDGLCVDDEDGAWVALWGGGAVVRLVDGRVEERVEVPTPQPTCPTFAGPDLDVLVVTSASIGLDATAHGAGDLYACRPGVRGRAPHRLGSWAS